MFKYSKKIFFVACFFSLIMAEEQAQTASNKNNQKAKSFLGNLLTATLDTTQNKEDLKEVIGFAAEKVADLVKNASTAKFVPKIAIDYVNGSEDEKKIILGNLMTETNNLVNNVGQAAEDYKVFDNIRARFYPSTLDLAYYGFVFGSAVFIGFNGFYYVQQTLKDYLATRKPKYISPFSKIGLFDQYKQKAKTFFYGLKKRANDAQLESISSILAKNCITHNVNKKQYVNCLMRLSSNNFAKNESTRLLGNVANKLGMDFIAVPSINLLQKNTVIDMWNELSHIIHKNNRPVLLYIDSVSLLSIDGTEYSEREECVRMLALAIKSSSDVLKSKCMIVGLLDRQESFEGPFAEIYTQQTYL
ncbi:hypothetical protein EKK58_02670 [Candidatus Dependentiae bacterium]|nr:MAG: hypothetical protein EKK58_02670 [Candidatus Dependentiae bacterium]